MSTFGCYLMAGSRQPCPLQPNTRCVLATRVPVKRLTGSSLKFLDRNPPNLPTESIRDSLREIYGLEGQMTRFDSERDQNTMVTSEVGQFLFKVCNAEEDRAVIDLQIAVLHHLAQVDPGLPVPRALPTISGAHTAEVTTTDGVTHVVRLMSFVEGETIRDHPEADTPALRRNTGGMLARLDVALRGFMHPAAQQDHPWAMTQAPALLAFTHHISDPKAQSLIHAILERMRDDSLPRAQRTRHQVVHQDAHTGNLVIDPTDPNQVAGIIDFGDLVYAPLIMDLAVASDLTGRPSWDPESLLDLAIGYDTVLPLESEEVDLLPDLVLGRMAMTATIVAARAVLFPDVSAYIDLEHDLWEQIQRVAEAAPELRQNLRRSLRFPISADTEKLRSDRKRVMSTPHFYEEPLHLERGDGVHLYGADGTRYLDFYNNVPTVGHSHPHVVNAIARQAAVLNTNTRYLYPNVVEYAQRLTESLGAGLDVCLFVNSGSEANDVAWQISRLVTGNEGLLVMEDAYHGITQAGLAMTTAKSLPANDHVQEIPAPDDYRGAVTEASQAAADTTIAIAALADRGFAPAAYIVDSAMCSSGIPDTPLDFLGTIAPLVRGAGGLVIADEVQSGFGRLGAMWGHELLGMKADIVTLGKPVGNGHPMGVVITSREILAQFQSRVRLFSTFGGNPVSCAAGLAVLDVIEREDLVENSRSTGDYLRAQLWKLADEHKIIGDVRGRGLLVGLELVTSRDTKAPATDETRRLIELLRQNGALVGKDGGFGHVLKLRPPLVTKPEDVDRFIAALDRSLIQLLT